MSPHASRPAFRTARAVVFATVCVVLASTAHVTAAGTVPAWSAVAGFGAVLGVTLLLAGHERSLATIVGGLLFGQFALHTLFTAASGPAHHHAAAHTHADGATPIAHGMHGMSGAHGTDGISMTLAHTAAALVAAWWLRRGERAAWTLARRAAATAERPIRVLLAVLGVEPAVPAPRTPAEPAAVAGPAIGRVVLRYEVVRRGPPPRSRALARF